MSDPGPFATLPRPPVVLQVLPRLNAGGGVERGTVDVAAAIVAAGGTALVASAEGPLTRELVRAGARHIALPLARKGPLAIWRNARKLAEIIAAEAVDIVHARSRAPAWSAWFACRRTGARFVTTYHGTYNEGLPGKRRYNAIMARGERVIAISRFIAEHLIARHGTDPARVRVIPRGIDPVRFDPARTAADRWMALARRWSLPDGAPLVLLPGRLTRWKGQLVAVEAMARIKRRDAVLVLAGDDEGRTGYRKELEDRITALDLLGRVRLVGHCDDMPAAMMLASVVLSASTDPEAFGRVAVEAQAMGRPVIATDHGGARETVIAGETGLLVPPNDADALAAAIDQALALTEPERAALAFRARENVLAHFTRARMCADTLAVYAELMETGAVAADRGP